MTRSFQDNKKCYRYTLLQNDRSIRTQNNQLIYWHRN